MSRAPYGARGLKSKRETISNETPPCRAPYGARGLKSQPKHFLTSHKVAPRMGRVD